MPLHRVTDEMHRIYNIGPSKPVQQAKGEPTLNARINLPTDIYLVWEGVGVCREEGVQTGLGWLTSVFRLVGVENCIFNTECY